MIKIYQEIGNETGNFIVLINSSVYEMSSNANQPNGLNMYCGEEFQLNQAQIKQIQLGDCPKGVLIGIIGRLEFEHLKDKANTYKEFINKCDQLSKI